MPKRPLYSRMTAFLLAVLLAIQPLCTPPVLELFLGNTLKTAHAAPPAQGSGGSLFLPIILNNAGPGGQAGDAPDFVINSPINDSAVGGVTFFAIQPTNGATIDRVTFRAGSTDLGADTTAGDGFRVFLNARNLPAGATELTATASGPGGETTKSINVTLVPNPPQSATIGTAGGVLASEIGSVISLLPGSVPEGTTVTVDELTQAETTTRHGIDWESTGVTFLGAQDVQASAPISGPFGMVASAGFGNRVQPGQAVVNYRIAPDADGDGADEIVVVNTASVAPNGDVVADPVVKIQIKNVNLQRSANGEKTYFGSSEFNGPPGAKLEFRGTGFNLVSLFGNVASFYSPISNLKVDFPGVVSVDSETLEQIFVTQIPPTLPPGPAVVTLINQSTGKMSDPINIVIEPLPTLTKPARQIINEFYEDAIATVNSTAWPDEITQYMQNVANALGESQSKISELYKAVDSMPAGDDKNRIEDSLTGIAQILSYHQFQGAIHRSTPFDTISSTLIGLAEAMAVGGAAMFTYGSAMSLFPPTAPAGAITAATGAFLFKASGFVGLAGLLLRPFDPPPPPNNCTACSTGMGAAPPPGGNGGGNAAGGGGGGGITASNNTIRQTSPVMVKIFSNGNRTPFTGMTDPGGYFFVPFIPAGEPFTALAIDTATGETRTFKGTGPATGESVFMFFDFFHDDGSGATRIQIGDVITGEISTSRELDLFSFVAAPGQRVFFDLQAYQGLSSQVNWLLTAPDGTEVFDTCLGCGDPGVKVLSQGGTYILTVGDTREDSTGTYRFQLWSVPPPNEFTINIGDVISDSVPGPGAGRIEGPGAEDVYRFTTNPGQGVFFDLQGYKGLSSQVNWRLSAPDGTEVFDTCLGCGDPGVKVLSQGGTYTLTVGDTRDDSTGTYRFQLWNVPPPNEFTINIGDVISDSVPGPGAGRIEVPGAEDVYRFTANPGQRVFFDLQGYKGLGSLVDWRLTAPDGTEVFDDCLGCNEPGAKVLSQGGTYILTVGDVREDSAGTYRFQLWNVPPPNEFTINIGDVISNGVPGPGAGNIETPGVEDHYRFSATAGQRVRFVVKANAGLGSLVNWRLTAPDGAELFDTCIGCSNPGVQTLAQNGTYLLVIGDPREDSSGTYRLELIVQ